MTDQEEVSVKGQFEYFTEKKEPKFSKPFETKINFDPENFDINNTTIINICNFKKKIKDLHVWFR